jgi:hypothetical protein
VRALKRDTYALDVAGDPRHLVSQTGSRRNRLVRAGPVELTAESARSWECSMTSFSCLWIAAA